MLLVHDGAVLTELEFAFQAVDGNLEGDDGLHHIGEELLGQVHGPRILPRSLIRIDESLQYRSHTGLVRDDARHAVDMRHGVAPGRDARVYFVPGRRNVTVLTLEYDQRL